MTEIDGASMPALPAGSTDAAGAAATWSAKRPARRVPVTWQFLLRRLASAVIALWGVLSIVFLLVNARPSLSAVGEGSTAEDVARIEHLLGYDRPLFERYVLFLRNAVTGSFPDSLRFSESPIHLILDRLPATLMLGATGLALGALIGSIAGYASVMARFRWVRELPLIGLGALHALPPVLFSVLLITVLSIHLHLLPTSGYGGIQHLILPALVLGASTAPPIGRVFRASLLETVGQDHVRTATAKGLPVRQVRLRHVALNAAGPMVNQIAIEMGSAFGGAVVVETIFGWPGIGNLTVSSLLNQDYPVVIASATFLGAVFVVMTFVADIVTAVLNPRGGQL